MLSTPRPLRSWPVDCALPTVLHPPPPPITPPSGIRVSWWGGVGEAPDGLVVAGLAGAAQADPGRDGLGRAVVRVHGRDDVPDPVPEEPVQQRAGGLGGETEPLV